eukprot:scaffold4766_cov160-Skeletonema_dohrnii-CCMP3373.AAC.4
MKTSTIVIICSSLAATSFVADALEIQQYPNPNLKGTQAQSAASDEFHNLDRHLSIEMGIEIDNHVALGDDSGYTYQFRMDLSTPLTPLIDSCINWDNFPGGVRPTNFTWYGISVQFPEDARAGFGASDTALAQPLKEVGFVQQFNDTAVGVAKYNFATSADRPVIRARINNGFFWNTFTFDFTGGSNYVEQRSQQSVSCTVEENADGTVLRSVVNPTLTVSLERLSSPAPVPTPAPEPSSSSMAGTFFAITALASSAFFLV